MLLSLSRPRYCRCRRLSKKLPFSRTRAGGGFPTHSISCSAGDALGNLPCTAWWALAKQRKRGRVVCFGDLSVREGHFVGIGPGLCIGTCTKGRESCRLCGAWCPATPGSGQRRVVAAAWGEYMGHLGHGVPVRVGPGRVDAFAQRRHLPHPRLVPCGSNQAKPSQAIKTRHAAHAKVVNEGSPMQLVGAKVAWTRKEEPLVAEQARPACQAQAGGAARVEERKQARGNGNGMGVLLGEKELEVKLCGVPDRT